MGLIGRSMLKRVAKGAPVGWMLLAGDLALIAGRHVGRLEAEERRRMAGLLAEAARHRGHLDADQRGELEELVARLQPRLLFGSAARRVSPMPLPKRLLYGRRGSPARKAAKQRS